MSTAAHTMDDALQPQVNQTERRCDACWDQKDPSELARAPCRHEYCRECLSTLFQDSMTDESLFPPRCCGQPVPLDENQVFLNADLVQQFRRKASELSSPDRTYCHNRNCSAFIPTVEGGPQVVSCHECGSRTCVACKNLEHSGDCPDDEELQQVLQLARDQRWQRCQNCRRVIELRDGCVHMM
ncbi:hypothetical protein diail_5944 [Diaporthe ilicicola]|nr:hypothetical protein diail_5944 [Diaporthe ilicicola]